MSAVLTSPKDFVSTERPTWCPGCGDYGVLQALQRAAAQVGLQAQDIVVASGVGCSGKISSYFNSYGFHSLHGRSLPIATGVKLANPNLTVVASGGDGDGYGIGAQHFLHAVRRNIDITYLVMDNHVYGLTKGQTAPTSATGFETTTTPFGSPDTPMHPLRLALAQGCHFIAQGFSAEKQQLTDLIAQAIRHKGFSLVNVISPCVTFNKVNTYDWFRERLHDLGGEAGYDPHDRAQAFSKLVEYDDLVRGLVFVGDAPSYQERLPGYTDRAMHEMVAPADPVLLDELVAEYR